MRPARRRLRLRRASPSPVARGPRWERRLALLGLCGLGFLLGRWTAPTPPLPAPPPPLVLTTTVAAAPLPCVEPKKPALTPKKRPLRPAPATPPGPSPTEAHLRAAASRLADCAPTGDDRVTAHLELDVGPDGKVTRVGLRNVDPLPPELGRCVEERLLGLAGPPPGGATTERYWLTVVL